MKIKLFARMHGYSDEDARQSEIKLASHDRGKGRKTKIGWLCALGAVW
ncbi:MAG TPA: hypothetical protein VGA09_00770 [Candidatus Binatia bacterium]